MAKMDKKWVILCSAAVAAVYGTGYFSTEAQANKLATQQQALIGVHTIVGQTGLNSANNLTMTNKSNDHSVNNNAAAGTNTAANTLNNSQAAANTSNTTADANTQPKQMYKDGTFNGMGMNRRGSIEVAVTLKNDKITDVEITNWGMHYSQRDVNGLPDEVIQRQSAQVDVVSGATYSTQAFADAVQDALNLAYNA